MLSLGSPSTTLKKQLFQELNSLPSSPPIPSLPPIPSRQNEDDSDGSSKSSNSSGGVEESDGKVAEEGEGVVAGFFDDDEYNSSAYAVADFPISQRIMHFLRGRKIDNVT
jgi:hypothetical protein